MGKGFESTIFSSPIRGSGGDATYRGNCCPGIIEKFIEQYDMKYLSDYAIGSGTTVDVCNRKHVNGYWTDLRLGFDLLNADIPDVPENIFYHPPYWNMNGKIIYSNTEYDWREVRDRYGYDPRLSDLSQIKSWDEFVKQLNRTVMKQFAALQKGGHMGILMGDIKTRGKLFSMLLEICKPGTVEQVIVKTQHNCVSDQTHYAKASFIRTVHEYLLILRKDFPYILDYQMVKTEKLDIRNSASATWKDVVAAALGKIGAPAELKMIYDEIEGYKRCDSNRFWKEKIRQTLQRNPCFRQNDTTWEIVNA